MAGERSAGRDWVLECLEHLEEMVIVTGPELDAPGPLITYVNAAFERITGWSRADAIGKSPRMLQGPGTDRETLDRVHETLARGHSAHFELCNYARDGREYWLRAHVHPVRAIDGRITSFIALQRDITEERRERDERQRLGHWFEGAANSSLSAIYVLERVAGPDGATVDYRIIYTNPRGAALLQAEQTAVVGTPLSKIIPPSRFAPLMAECQQVEATNESLVVEFEVPEFPEQDRWIRHQIVPMPGGVAITSENITPRKQAELALRARERMLQSFLKHCPGMAWISDEHGNTLTWNAAFEDMVHRLGRAGRPGTLWEIFPPEQAELYHRNNLRVIESGQPERLLEPGPRADGSIGEYETFKFPLGEREGVRLVGGIALDITDREGEQRAAERLAAIVRSSGDAIQSLDLQGHIVSWNHGSEQLYGYRAEEIIGRHLSVLVPPEHLAQTNANLDRIRRGARSLRFDSVRRRKDGLPVFVQVSLSPIVDRDGRLVGISKIDADMGERQRREEQSRYYAEHDPVTGALNEHGLLLAAERRFAAAPTATFAMLRISVDRYSEFRDVFGVQYADALARAIVQRLQGTLAGREHNVASIGHNQFAVLVACSRNEADCLGQRLEQLAATLAEPLDVQGIEVSIGIQCGAAHYPEHARDAEALMRCADLAFGQARRNADHRPVVYAPTMGEHVAYQVRLQQELSRAIARAQLRVVLQPIFDAASPPRMIGMEALARWHHPELGEVPPSRFIPVAEESGLIPDIGEFVLREACRLKAELDAAGHDHLFLSVNVSRDQFRRGDLAAQVQAVLANSGVKPGRLELEITEGVLMEHTAESERQLKALSAMGVGLAVDDFGTGYSSLAYLQRFPVTKLKVDRSFVMGLPEDRGASEIVRAIITLAHALGLETLAEGVENAGQLQALALLGCRQHQGYYFSRPLEADAMADFLKSGGHK